MSWHPDCWFNSTGIKVKGSRAKFQSRCDAGDKCIRNGTISIGDLYYWAQARKSWNTSSTAAIPSSVPSANSNWNTPNTNQAHDFYDDVERHAIESEVKSETPNAAKENAKIVADESMIKDIVQRIVNSPDLHTRQERSVRDKCNAITASNRINISAAVAKEVDHKLDKLVRIDDIIAKVLVKLNEKIPTRVEIQDKTGEVKDCGIQHKQFPTLIKAISARVNVWMAGPTASGKTTAAQNAAQALGHKFYYCGAIGDPYALLGYNDANGRYVRTSFREAYEHGGVFLFDEIDSSEPNALLAFNAALANGAAPFPDGIITKHKDCIMVAAANTWGAGATQEYVGRLKMDAAFLKRFAFISWDYDAEMEMATAPNPAWTKRVQDIRARIKEKGIRAIVSPRESYIGAQLLASGIDQEAVEKMTIFSSLTDAQITELSKASSKSKY
jgi:hypothetical protein